MRGKRDLVEEQIRPIRNIPAYAGKTPRKFATGDQGAEHPRVCGENLRIVLTMGGDDGTSPRMRGKPIAASTPPR